MAPAATRPTTTAALALATTTGRLGAPHAALTLTLPTATGLHRRTRATTKARATPWLAVRRTTTTLTPTLATALPTALTHAAALRTTKAAAKATATTARCTTTTAASTTLRLSNARKPAHHADHTGRGTSRRRAASTRAGRRIGITQCGLRTQTRQMCIFVLGLPLIIAKHFIFVAIVKPRQGGEDRFLTRLPARSPTRTTTSA